MSELEISDLNRLAGLKTKGFDKSQSLESRKQSLVEAIELRVKLGLPKDSESGWVGEPPNKRDLLTRELERVRKKIEAGSK